MWKRLKQILGFYATAVSEEFRRSRWFKIMTILSVFSNVLTYLGLFFNIRIPLPTWSWQSWITLAAVTTFILLMLVFVAVHRFHKRTIGELNAEHEKDVGKLESDMSKQDEDWRKEVEKLEAQITSLKKGTADLRSQLEAPDRYNLIFEIDAHRSSQVYVHPDTHTGKVLDNGTAKYEDYIIDVNLRIRFQNRDVHKDQVKEVKVAVLRLGNGEEQEIPLQDSTVEETEEGAGKVKLSEMDILPTRVTPYYWFHYVLKLEAQYAERLDQNCFLRVTMEVVRKQPSYHADLNVNWEIARQSQDWTYITLKK